jgi:hypothetical protein
MSGFVGIGSGIIGGDGFATAIQFNNSRYLERGGAWTDPSNSNALVMSIWFNPSIVNSQCLFSSLNTSGSHPAIDIRFGFDRNIQMTFASDASTSNYVRAAYTHPTTFVNKWTHLLMRLLLVNNGSGGTITSYELFINDVAQTFSSITRNGTGADQFIFRSSNAYIGRGIGNTPLSLTNTFCDDVCIAEPFVSSARGGFTAIDLTMRRKFITSELKPVYLGGTAQLPNGTQQLLYLSNPLGSWKNNRGYGGGMTLQNGALVACGSKP